MENDPIFTAILFNVVGGLVVIELAGVPAIIRAFCAWLIDEPYYG